MRACSVFSYIARVKSCMTSTAAKLNPIRPINVRKYAYAARGPGAVYEPHIMYALRCVKYVHALKACDIHFCAYISALDCGSLLALLITSYIWWEIWGCRSGCALILYRAVNNTPMGPFCALARTFAHLERKRLRQTREQ